MGPDHTHTSIHPYTHTLLLRLPPSIRPRTPRANASAPVPVRRAGHSSSRRWLVAFGAGRGGYPREWVNPLGSCACWLAAGGSGRRGDRRPFPPAWLSLAPPPPP